jgi:hypothetical protein
VKESEKDESKKEKCRENRWLTQTDAHFLNLIALLM